MASLPPFLHDHPSDGGGPPTSGYSDAVFQHKHPFGVSHALWWPAKEPTPETVILFIPGNPGLLDFYSPFLNAIHEKDTTSKLAIFAHSHIGHTPRIESPNSLPESRYGLAAQVEGSVEAFDAIRSTYGADTRVVIVGHSVGAWLSLQVLKARPATVSGVFLLFPTISSIGDTPNGRRISWLFSPRMRTFISRLSYLTKIMPIRLLALVYRGWPLRQILVLRGLLHSPPSVLAALHMAHDEMKEIRDLDISLLDAHKNRLWFYFAEQDDWVGDQKDVILHSFKPGPHNVRVVHGHQDIPHAFCISKSKNFCSQGAAGHLFNATSFLDHGEVLAQQCHEWLADY